MYYKAQVLDYKGISFIILFRKDSLRKLYLQVVIFTDDCVIRGLALHALFIGLKRGQNSDEIPNISADCGNVDKRYFRPKCGQINLN